MLQWSEQFETGHPLLDTQHRMLISYINRLEELAQHTAPSHDDVELFLRFVEFLEDYILTHFREEEDCMHRFKCPVHAENQMAHRSFLDFFRKFKLRLEGDGYRPDVMAELYESCSAWIQQHILRIDVQLKPCLNRPADSEELEDLS
jgi:hemerythrin